MAMTAQAKFENMIEFMHVVGVFDATEVFARHLPEVEAPQRQPWMSDVWFMEMDLGYVCQCAKLAFGNESVIRDQEEQAGDSLQNLAKELDLLH